MPEIVENRLQEDIMQKHLQDRQEILSKKWLKREDNENEADHLNNERECRFWIQAEKKEKQNPKRLFVQGTYFYDGMNIIIEWKQFDYSSIRRNLENLFCFWRNTHS